MLLANRRDFGCDVLEAAPPPPGTIVGILGTGVVFPVGAVGRHKLDPRMEANEWQILDSDLHELHRQLVGLFIVGGQFRQLMDNPGRFGIVPAGTLAGATLTQRNDQVCVPATDLGVNILGDSAGWPIAGNLEVTGGAIIIPSRTAFAGQGAVEAELYQLVICGNHAAAGLSFGIGQIGHVDGKGFTFEIPAVSPLFQAGFYKQLLSRFGVILPASDTEHVYQSVLVGRNVVAFSSERFSHSLGITGIERLNRRTVAQIQFELFQPGKQGFVIKFLHCAGSSEDWQGTGATDAVEDTHGDLIKVHGQRYTPAEIGIVIGLLGHLKGKALGARVVTGGVGELVIPASNLVVFGNHDIQHLRRDFAQDVDFVVDHGHLAGGIVAKIPKPDVLGLGHLAGHYADGAVLPILSTLIEDPLAQFVIGLHCVGAGHHRIAVLEGGHILHLGIDVLGNDAEVITPDGDSESERQAWKGLLGHDLDGVFVHLLHGFEHGIVVIALADTGVGHNHVEREHNIICIEVFTVGPFDALTDLHYMLGEIRVGLGHTVGHFAELLTLDGIHFPHHRRHKLMNAKSHRSALHVGVKLPGHVGRGLGLDDEGFPAGSAHFGHLLIHRLIRSLTSRHCGRKQEQNCDREENGQDLFVHKNAS